MYICELCGNEMIETSVPIKVKGKRKVKEILVSCHRCTLCKNVGLTEGQILQLPDGVNLDDFQSYALLQRVIATSGLERVGLLTSKKSSSTEEVLFITA